jgi:threonine dehydratase
MRTQQPGVLTFPVVQQLGVGVKTVSDDEVKVAMRLLLLRLKLLVEPTGAVPAALLLSGRWREPGDTGQPRVGVILSGGNVDPGLLCEVLSEARGGD